MAKKTKQQNKKKITFKFSPTKEGGSVSLEGIHWNNDAGDYEDVPKEIVNVLESYGFTDGREAEQYIDCCAPGYGMSLDEDLKNITDIVPISISSKVEKNRGRTLVTFLCSLGKATIAEDRILSAAMAKAHKLWNKAGRPINGVTFEKAMEDVLKKVNKG